MLLVVLMSGLSSKVEHKLLDQLADFGSSPGAGTNNTNRLLSKSGSEGEYEILKLIFECGNYFWKI